jgi:Tfp pilus assembly protein PilX
MDIAGARKFHASKRSLALTVSLITLLGMSMFWNLQQRRLIAAERQRLMALQSKETARANEEAERAAELKKKNAKWAGADARLQQLYREIDALSRLNEQVVAQPQPKRSTPPTIDNPAATIRFP